MKVLIGKAKMRTIHEKNNEIVNHRWKKHWSHEPKREKKIKKEKSLKILNKYRTKNQEAYRRKKQKVKQDKRPNS